MVDGTLEHIKKDNRLQHCKSFFLSAKKQRKDIKKDCS
jgi:hypothetical protein